MGSRRFAGPIALVALAMLSVACGSSPTGDQACTHPCDLQQSLWVSIAGAPSAMLMGSGACEGGGMCTEGSSCSFVNIHLAGTATIPVQGPDMICHVTAVAPSGERVEQDVSAHYTASFCCPGYELPAFTKITFNGGDAGARDGSETF